MKHTIAEFERNKPKNLTFEEFKLSGGYVTKAIGLLHVQNGSIRAEFDGSGRLVRPGLIPNINIDFPS